MRRKYLTINLIKQVMSKAVHYYVKWAIDKKTIGRYKYIYIFENMFGYFWENGKYYPSLELCKMAIDNLINK